MSCRGNSDECCCCPRRTRIVAVGVAVAVVVGVVVGVAVMIAYDPLHAALAFWGYPPGTDFSTIANQNLVQDTSDALKAAYTAGLFADVSGGESGPQRQQVDVKALFEARDALAELVQLHTLSAESLGRAAVDGFRWYTVLARCRAALTRSEMRNDELTGS